jgi:hypothetical protein
MLFNSNKDGNYLSMSRSKLNYFRIILITSLFWVFIDAFLLLYLTDYSCTKLANTRLGELPCEQEVETLKIELSRLRDKYERTVKALGSHSQKLEAENQEEEELKRRNERLKKIHEFKRKNEEKTNPPHFLDKLKEWFREDNSHEPTNPPSWPGENGRAVVIPEHLKEESNKRFKENQFNIVASDLIALNRSVPDQRSQS